MADRKITEVELIEKIEHDAKLLITQNDNGQEVLRRVAYNSICNNYTGECSADADDPLKTVEVGGGFTLEDKTIVSVRFTNGFRTNIQTQNTIALNVNNSGAYAVSINGVDPIQIYGRNSFITDAGGVISFMYQSYDEDGVWTIIGNNYAERATIADSVEDGCIREQNLDSALVEKISTKDYYGVCETASDNPAKTVTIPNLASLTEGTPITIQFKNGLRGTTQASGNRVTLNVNGSSACIIRFNGVDDSMLYDNTDLIVESGGTLPLIYHVDDIDNIGYFTCNMLNYVDRAIRADTSVDTDTLKEHIGDAETFHSDYNKTVVDALREAWVETLTDTETRTVSVELSLNTSYIYGELTSLEITDILPTSENVGCHEISFTSGATATNFVYPDGWLWKGDDCEDYVFVPQANTYYEMIIEYRNGIVTGYVAGFETTESEE